MDPTTNPIQALTFESIFNEQIDSHHDNDIINNQSQPPISQSEQAPHRVQNRISRIASQSSEKTSTTSSNTNGPAPNSQTTLSPVTPDNSSRPRDRWSEAQLSETQLSEATTVDTTHSGSPLAENHLNEPDPPPTETSNTQLNPLQATWTTPPEDLSTSQDPEKSHVTTSQDDQLKNVQVDISNTEESSKKARSDKSKKPRRSSHATVRSEAQFPASLLLFDSTQRLKYPSINSSRSQRLDGCGVDLQEYMLDANGKAKKFSQKLTDASSVTGPGFATLPASIAASPASRILAASRGVHNSPGNSTASTPASSPGVSPTTSISPPEGGGRGRHSSNPVLLTSPLGSSSLMTPTAAARRRASLMQSTSFTSTSSPGLPIIPESSYHRMRNDGTLFDRFFRSSRMESFVCSTDEPASSSPATSISYGYKEGESAVPNVSSPKRRNTSLFGKNRKLSNESFVARNGGLTANEDQNGFSGTTIGGPGSARRKLALKALKAFGLSSEDPDPTTQFGQEKKTQFGQPTKESFASDWRLNIDPPTRILGFSRSRRSKLAMGSVNCCGERPDKAAKNLARDSAATFLSGKGTENDLDKFDKAYASDDISGLVALVKSEEPFKQSTEEHLHPWASPPKTVGALAATQLAALASTDDMDTKEKIRTAGAIKILINQLKSPHSDRVDAALVALSFLSIDFSKACVAMFEEDIFPSLISLLKGHKIGVMAAAAQTARNIYVLEVRYRRAFREMGGCQPLVDLLDLPPNNNASEEDGSALDLQFEAIYHIDDFIMFNGEEVSDCVAAIKACSAARKLNVLQNVQGNDDLREAAHQLYLRLAE